MIEIHTNINGASRPSGPCVTPGWWGRSRRGFTECLTSKNGPQAERGTPGDAHNWIVPIRSTGSLPLHLRASDSGF